jgi:hypothetical protein
MTTPGAITASVILCDFAQSWQGKLFISGAGINVLGVPNPEPPHPISIHVAVLVTVPWNAHNQLHTLRVSLLDQEEKVVELQNVAAPPGSPPDDAGRVIAKFNVGRGPQMMAGDESIIPVALPLQAHVAQLDSYHVVAEIDGSEAARARFRVMHAPQGQLVGFGPGA